MAIIIAGALEAGAIVSITGATALAGVAQDEHSPEKNSTIK